MLDRMAAGELPGKPHTVLRGPEGELRYEQCLTRSGFDGPFSMLYLQARPQAWTAVVSEHGSPPAAAAHGDDPLRRRHYRTQRLAAGSEWSSSQSPLLESADILLSIVKPTRSDAAYFMNADADELCRAESA